MTSETITVTARQWAHGWELILSEDDATQVRSLAHAQQQIRDYLDSVDPDTDHSHVQVALVLDGASEEIERARQARREAERAEAEAARRIRDVVADLRHHRGFSISDTAALLGVSRGRISQLERNRETSLTKPNPSRKERLVTEEVMWQKRVWTEWAHEDDTRTDGTCGPVAELRCYVQNDEQVQADLSRPTPPPAEVTIRTRKVGDFALMTSTRAGGSERKAYLYLPPGAVETVRSSMVTYPIPDHEKDIEAQLNEGFNEHFLRDAPLIGEFLGLNRDNLWD